MPQAQGQTFQRVFEILQTHCSQCHGGSNPIAYDLGTTPTETYTALVGVMLAGTQRGCQGTQTH
ncbi:MAG: hypothetical protein U0176_22345 [Bacteroidia bacterium]